MVVCVEFLPADKPWDVVSATRRSSGVAPWACVRVYARVLVPPKIFTHIHTYIRLFLAPPLLGLPRRQQDPQELGGPQVLRVSVRILYKKNTLRLKRRHTPLEPSVARKVLCDRAVDQAGRVPQPQLAERL